MRIIEVKLMILINLMFFFHRGHECKLQRLEKSFSQTLKDTLWVLRGDEPLVHVSVDISLITYILDHDTSLKS